MKCHNCEKPAMYVVGPEEARVPVCLDCYLKLMQAAAIQSDMLERQINYLGAYIDLGVGLPGLTPRFPERRVVQTGDITLHNIRVESSSVGVINTGTIGTVDAAVTTLKHSGNPALATAIQTLTEAAISSREATEEVKEQIVEILSVLATEAAAPKERCRSTVVRRLLVDLATLFSGVQALAQLWQQYGPLLESFFR